MADWWINGDLEQRVSGTEGDVATLQPVVAAAAVEVYDIEKTPLCSSDAATNGVGTTDYLPLLWWKAGAGGIAPDDNGIFSFKVQLSTLRDGDSSPRAATADITGMICGAYLGGGALINAIINKDGVATAGGDPVASVSASSFGANNEYGVLHANVTRSTVTDIAGALLSGTGPYAPRLVYVRANWTTKPNFPAHFVEGIDWGYGNPPGWPETSAEFFDLVDGNTFPSPLSFWKLPAPIGNATYDTDSSVSAEDLCSASSSNNIPWYGTHVRIRITNEAGDTDLGASAWQPRETAYAASITFDETLATAIGIGNNFRIYVDYKAPDTAQTVKGDFILAQLLQGGGGA